MVHMLTEACACKQTDTAYDYTHACCSRGMHAHASTSSRTLRLPQELYFVQVQQGEQELL